VTAIYYANPVWCPEDGGALRLHGDEGPIDVAPILDRLLVFLSERVEHEVLPAVTPRRAVTAWFGRGVLSTVDLGATPHRLSPRVCFRTDTPPPRRSHFRTA
jgi:hypothetical protein